MAETITPRSRAFWAGWICAAAGLLVAAAAGVYAANLRNQYEDVTLRLVDAVTKLQLSEQRLTGATSELAAIHTNLSLLSAPDAQVLTLTGRGVAAAAAGRAFISRTRGLLFSANRMPPLAEGSVYQLWLLTRGAPVSAGVFRAAEDGSVTAAFDPPGGDADAAGVAVSVEPEDGSTRPTTEFLLGTK